MSGLYYYGVRYYDPGIGRFLTVDPLLNTLNPNKLLRREIYKWSPYVYCNDNPLKYIDPYGENPTIIKTIAKTLLKKVIKNPKVHRWLAKKLGKKTAEKLIDEKMFGTEDEILRSDDKVYPIGYYVGNDENGNPLYVDPNYPNEKPSTKEELNKRYTDPISLPINEDKEKSNGNEKDEKKEDANTTTKKDKTEVQIEPIKSEDFEQEQESIYYLY